jgi:UDP-glucose 4-epimerase
MKKILVTGAMGFVGSHWSEYLLKKGLMVYGIDINVSYPELLDYQGFKFYNDSIKNYDLLETLIAEVDCVCHFAGIAEPAEYIKNPHNVIEITALSSIKIIDLCRQHGKKIFYSSTSEIYGKNNQIPFKETDDRVIGATTTKRWCYSTSKALVEHYLDACTGFNDLTYLVVRLFNVYGPRLKGRVVSDFLESVISEKPITVHAKGLQTRSFTYIDDVMDAFFLLMNNKACENHVFNVGSEVETSIIELAEIIKEECRVDSKIVFQSHGEFYGKSYEDIDRRVPDASKIKEFTGWEATTSLRRGLNKTVDYMKNLPLSN